MSPPPPPSYSHSFISHFPLARSPTCWQTACPPNVGRTVISLWRASNFWHMGESSVNSISCGHFYFCHIVGGKKGKGERWVQTFLVVKGRNLQLSNKSLRLNPSCDWLRRATWRTLYEHELYAVVYSLVLPLYQQQTKLGRRNRFFLL